MADEGSGDAGRDSSQPDSSSSSAEAPPTGGSAINRVIVSVMCAFCHAKIRPKYTKFTLIR